MIVDAIDRYLINEGKTLNESVMSFAAKRFDSILRRQLMEDRKTEAGKINASQIGKCIRQTAYKFHNLPSEEIGARGKMNFLIGDIVELCVLSLAELAGLDIRQPEKMHIEHKGAKIGLVGDGILYQNNEPYAVVEIKKVSDWALEEAIKDGKMNDTWGYKTQGHLYAHAYDIGKVLWVLVSVNGHKHEIKENYESDLALTALERASEVTKTTPEKLPERPFKPVPDIYYKKDTGIDKLCLQCSYCNYKGLCYPGAKLETRGGKPLWTLPRVR